MKSKFLYVATIAAVISMLSSSLALAKSGVTVEVPKNVVSLATLNAVPTASKVMVNGKGVAFEAYNINNNNYFKLRDLAAVVSGTEKQFEVSWDGNNNAISLESGNAYTSVGGELNIDGNSKPQTAAPTNSKIFIDGQEIKFIAYTISGNNYFKLRDIAKAFNIGITWDGTTNTIGIDTAIDYIDPDEHKVGTTIEEVKQVDKGSIVNGIEVRYGKHDYASKNQAEYDKVMDIIDEAIKGLDDVKFGGDRHGDHYVRYLEGDRPENYKKFSKDNISLSAANGDIGVLVEAGISKDDVILAWKIQEIAREFNVKAKDPKDGSPRSAYDALVRFLGDCDSEAQVMSALFDAVGINNGILAGNSHADVFVEFNGQWFLEAAGSFAKMDVGESLAAGNYVMSQPTTGPTFQNLK